MTEDNPIEESLRLAAEAHKLAGNQLFSEGKFEDAVREYVQAIQKDPTVAVYYSNAATCHSRTGSHERALEMINQALRLDPDFTKAYYRRGVCLMELRRFQEASEDFVRVCRELPSDVEAQKRLKACDREVDRRVSFEEALRSGFSSAIRVERFDLTRKCIEALSVDANYAGPVVDFDTPLTVEWVRDTLVPFFSADRKLNIKHAYTLLLRAKEVFETEASLVDVAVEEDETLTVCGDIHGQFFDLLEIFRLNGYPDAKHKYLFNGDVVDRGSYSIECVLTLCALKAAAPGSLFVSRGNHESEPINRVHGFYDECSKKYNHQFFSLANQVLNCLPIGYVLGGKIFVVHGGLPDRTDLMLDDIRAINRFTVPENGSLFSQLLWSDPQEQPGISPSHRGEGVLFGPDITRDFLQRNGLTLMIRSHVWQPSGYAIEQNGQCVTIFSAPDYTGTVSLGAWINVNGRLEMDYQQFSAAKYQGKAVKARPSMPIRGGWY